MDACYELGYNQIFKNYTQCFEDVKIFHSYELMSCEFLKIQENKYLIKNKVAGPAVVVSYIPNITSFFFNISGKKQLF